MEDGNTQYDDLRNLLVSWIFKLFLIWSFSVGIIYCCIIHNSGFFIVNCSTFCLVKIFQILIKFNVKYSKSYTDFLNQITLMYDNNFNLIKLLTSIDLDTIGFTPWLNHRLHVSKNHYRNSVLVHFDQAILIHNCF